MDRACRAHARARAHRRRREDAQSSVRTFLGVAEVLADGPMGRARGRQASRGVRAAPTRSASGARRGARVMSWLDLGPLSALPERGARCVRLDGLTIAVFRTSTGEVF